MEVLPVQTELERQTARLGRKSTGNQAKASRSFLPRLTYQDQWMIFIHQVISKTLEHRGRPTAGEPLIQAIDEGRSADAEQSIEFANWAFSTRLLAME